MSIDELYHLIRTEECCLWIGAGFSLYAGYPSASELQKQLMEDLTPAEMEELSAHATLAEFCYEYQTIKSRATLIDRLQQIFGLPPMSTDHHKLLAKLSYFRSIITTNYDHLIEDAFPLAERVVIKGDVDVPDANSNKVKIYKIHGDFTDGNSMVITRQDYARQYDRNFKDPFWASVIHEISTKHVIFLGYGYEDENIWADFEYIHDKLVGRQKKRFMIAPSFTHMKLKKLQDQNIIAITMTGFDFLNGFVPVVRKCLASDLRNNLVNPDIALKFARNFDVNLDLSSSLGGVSIVSATQSNGPTEHKVSLQIKDPEMIDMYAKFQEDYDRLILDMGKHHLSNFSMSAAGFELIDLEYIHEFRIVHMPTSAGVCTIEFPNLDKEFAAIEFKLYTNIPGKLLIDLKFLGFHLVVKGTLDNQKFDYKLEMTEPKNGGRVSSYLQFYELLYSLLNGERFKIYVPESRVVDCQLSAVEDLLPFAKHLNNFTNIRTIEKALGITFPNISHAKFEKQSILELQKLLSIAEHGGFTIQYPEGLLFDSLPRDPDFLRMIEDGFPKGGWVILTATKPMQITIFDVTVDLGEVEVLMIEPVVEWYNAENSSMLLKTSDNQFNYRFPKFSRAPRAVGERMWENPMPKSIDSDGSGT